MGCDVDGSARTLALTHAEVLREGRVVAFDGTALDFVDVDFVCGAVNGDGATQAAFVTVCCRFANPVRTIRAPGVDDVPFDERVLRPAINADVGVRHVGIAFERRVGQLEVGVKVSEVSVLEPAVHAVADAFAAEVIVHVAELAGERAVGVERGGVVADVGPEFVTIVSDIVDVVGGDGLAFAAVRCCVAKILSKSARGENAKQTQCEKGTKTKHHIRSCYAPKVTKGTDGWMVLYAFKWKSVVSVFFGVGLKSQNSEICGVLAGNKI